MSIVSHGWILFSQIGKEVMEVPSWNNCTISVVQQQMLGGGACEFLCGHVSAFKGSWIGLKEPPGWKSRKCLHSTNLYFWSHILVPLKHHPGQLGHYGSPRKMVRGDPRGDLLIKKAPKLLWEQVFCIQNSFGPLYWAIPIAKAPQQNFRHILRPRATCR